MSGRETKGDATGWKRGEKGFAVDKTSAEITRESYNKERNANRERPVGQIATTGDNADGKQRGY